MTKIVKFDNGKFAVRKGSRFFGYYYLDPGFKEGGVYWWTAYYKKQAFLDTVKEAEQLLDLYKKASTKAIDHGTPI